MTPLTLSDDVIELSRPEADDLDDITTACQDPEIAAWVTVPSPYTRDDAEGFVTHVVEPGWASGRELTWAIRRDGRLMGMIGLVGIADGSAEIGYWVAPWARRQGLLRRAVALVVEHAFAPDGQDLVRLSWHAYTGNWPSRRVAWGAGFRYEGVARLGGLQRGVRRDSWVGSLLRYDPREPNEPWPADAPADGAAVVPDVLGVPVPDHAPAPGVDEAAASTAPTSTEERMDP